MTNFDKTNQSLLKLKKMNVDMQHLFDRSQGDYNEQVFKSNLMDSDEGEEGTLDLPLQIEDYNDISDIDKWGKI